MTVEQEERHKSLDEIKQSLGYGKEQTIKSRRPDTNDSTGTIAGKNFGAHASNAERIIRHINVLLAEVELVRHMLPLEMDGPNSFFVKSRDGVLTCELINVLAPETIKLSKVHRDFSKKAQSQFLMLENQTMALQACRKLGCRIVNLGPCDLVAGKPYLVLGIVWQIIKRGMIERIKREAASSHSTALVLYKPPEAGLPRHSGNDEEAEDQDTRAVILHLVNHQVHPEASQCGAMVKVENFQGDLADGQVMAKLLLDAGCEEALCTAVVRAPNMQGRADAIVRAGREVLGEHCLLESRDIVQGNEQMLLVFLAALLRKAMSHQPHDSDSDYTCCEVIEMDSSELDEKICRLEGEVERLRQENEQQADMLVSLGAQLEATRMPVSPSVSSLSLESMDRDLTTNYGRLPDSIFRDNTDHRTDVYIPTDENAFRLRQIYQHSADLAGLAQAIYGPLKLGNLMVEKGTSKMPMVHGHLRKKDRNALKWRRRLFLLRENFLFIFPEDSGPKSEVLEVLRVDDALVRVMFEVQHLEDPVISVEIASKANPFYLYLSADATTLAKWKEAIARASGYWVLTR